MSEPNRPEDDIAERVASETINDGGPAFPCAGFTGGMALRAWLAGQALAGFCANPAIFAGNPNSGWGLVNCTDEQLIAYSTHLADLQIAELSKPKPKTNE